MKSYLAILSLSIALTASAQDVFSLGDPVVHSFVNPVGVQTCVSNTSFSNNQGSWNIADTYANKLVSVSNYNTTASFNLCRMDWWIKYLGTTPGDLVAEVRANNSGSPGALLAISTTTIHKADATTSYSWIPFQFDGTFVMTNGATVWVGLNCTLTNAVNYWSVQASGNSGAGSGNVYAAPENLSWAAYSSRSPIRSFYGLQ